MPFRRIRLNRRSTKTKNTGTKNTARIVAEIMPGFGRMGVPSKNRPIISASPINVVIPEDRFPHGMKVPGGRTSPVPDVATIAEIQAYEAEMIDAAVRAENAGWDGVDVESGTIHGKPAVMGGFWGSHLGVIDLMLEFDGDEVRVVTHASEVRPIYQRGEDRSITPTVESDAEVEAAARAAAGVHARGPDQSPHLPRQSHWRGSPHLPGSRQARCAPPW